ncbi:hypothetical protein COZ55_00170, partial [archaeon CG_4_8_14_3_um_filter_38_5]
SKSLLFYSAGSFRISCQRVDKNFRMTSSEVCREVGAFIAGKTGAKVDLENYDLNISVELFNNKAYLFSEKLRGFGGLPAGSEGKVLCIVNDEAGLLSALMMMNRGCYPLITGSKGWFDKLVKFAPHLALKFYPDYSGIIKWCGAVVKSGRLDANLFMKDKEVFALPVLYPLIGLDKNVVKGKYFSAMSR